MRSRRGLANADEYPTGKGYPQLASDLGGAEADAGALAGGELVGTARLIQAGADAFQHQAHGRVEGLQAGHFAAAHGAGVGMGQQGSFFQDQAAHIRQIVEGGPVAPLPEPVRRFRVALLGTLSQGEQRLGAAEFFACFGHSQDLVGGHVEFGSGIGVLAEGAVAAEVAAESGEGNEHLGGKADHLPPATVAQFGSDGGHFGSSRRPGASQGKGIIRRQPRAARGAMQHGGDAPVFRLKGRRGRVRYGRAGAQLMIPGTIPALWQTIFKGAMGLLKWGYSIPLARCVQSRGGLETRRRASGAADGREGRYCIGE